LLRDARVRGLDGEQGLVGIHRHLRPELGQGAGAAQAASQSNAQPSTGSPSKGDDDGASWLELSIKYP